MLDLSRAVVVTPAAADRAGTQGRRAARRGCGAAIREFAGRCSPPGRPSRSRRRGRVVLCRQGFTGPFAEFFGDGTRPRPAEGYRIRSEAKGPAVLVAGNDARGVLFGIGRLLRELRTTEGRVLLPSGFQLETGPRYPLRGHQLGYRPKTNSYDAWDLPRWERYIRDLAIFGTNAVELIPPRSDDDAESPHFPRPPLEMMVGMSRLLDDYGLDVWIWYPAMDKDYSDPRDSRRGPYQEWDEVFRKLPRLDAVFVPGGDPGHTPPPVLMPFLGRVAEVLHRSHPRAHSGSRPRASTRNGSTSSCRSSSKNPPG